MRFAAVSLLPLRSDCAADYAMYSRFRLCRVPQAGGPGPVSGTWESTISRLEDGQLGAPSFSRSLRKGWESTNPNSTVTVMKGTGFSPCGMLFVRFV